MYSEKLKGASWGLNQRPLHEASGQTARPVSLRCLVLHTKEVNWCQLSNDIYIQLWRALKYVHQR